VLSRFAPGPKTAAWMCWAQMNRDAGALDGRVIAPRIRRSITAVDAIQAVCVDYSGSSPAARATAHERSGKQAQGPANGGRVSSLKPGQSLRGYGSDRPAMMAISRHRSAGGFNRRHILILAESGHGKGELPKPCTSGVKREVKNPFSPFQLPPPCLPELHGERSCLRHTRGAFTGRPVRIPGARQQARRRHAVSG